MSMIEALVMVEEFKDKMGGPNDAETWARLIREERDELKEAFANVLKEGIDLGYVIGGYMLTADPGDASGLSDDEIEEIRELAYKFNSLFPLEVREEALRRVHASNMSKLGEDGKPIRREDGKILKGPNYAPPVLDDLITVG